MSIRIIEDVVMKEEVIDQNINSRIVVEGNKSLKELLESEVFKELKRRIHEGDYNALSVLIAAKEKVKQDLPKYANAIKLTLLAFKPVYLITLIDMWIQTPTPA